MKVLSVRQPFAWLLANGYQDVENRNHPWDYVGPVLIHAGKEMDRQYTDPQRNGRQALEFLLFNSGPSAPFQTPWYDWATMGRNWDWPPLPADDQFERGGIVGIAYMDRCESWKRQPRLLWRVGPYCYVMKYALPLPFTPCKGHLEPWDATKDLIAAVYQRLWSDKASPYRTRLRTFLEGNREVMAAKEQERPLWDALWHLYGEKAPAPNERRLTTKRALIHLRTARDHLPGLVPTWERIVAALEDKGAQGS